MNASDVSSNASHAAPRPLSWQAINGWRGPGALAIAIGHFAVATDFSGVDHLQRLAVLVDLFFVLSGVIIAQSYGAKLTRASAIPEYVVRRFGRIWPVHAATLAVLVAYECGKLLLVNSTGKAVSFMPFAPEGINLPVAIPTNLLLIHSIGVHDRETWNFPSWSLSVEFVTYVIFALFCLVAPVPRRILAVATIGLSLAVLVWVAPNGMRSTYDYGIFRCLAGFLAGTLIYDVVVRWPMPRWPLPTLVEIVAFGGALAWMEASDDSPLVYAAPLVFCILIFVFASEQGALSRFFKGWLFQKGAELSFAIYMVHAIVLIGVMMVMHEIERQTHQALFITAIRPWPGPVRLLHVDGVVGEVLLVSVYLAGVVGAALAVYTFVEVPGRAIFNRLAKRLQGGARRAPRTRGVATATDATSPGV